MKKAFTLMETILVLFIIGLLSGILVKTYVQMSKISFRIEQEKNVTQELFFVSEVLQNFADRNSIDFAKYNSKENLNYLTDNKGLVKNLYLSGL
ncbi:MAG: type II secretion system protein, partial [bacterium]|nr:type II secretion system protein [bacterium]